MTSLWDRAASDFEPGSALRDIYVVEATPNDWRAVVDEIHSFQPSPTYTLDDVAAAMPDTVGEISTPGRVGRR